MEAHSLPEMQNVQSSQIAAIGYDGASKQLFVRFHGKGGQTSTYRYDDVPEDVHRQMVAADAARESGASVGQIFHRLVKQGGFRYERI